LYLRQLRLVNFRNYGQQQISFYPYFNFIVGNNAQGKTNLIEAIYYLSTGRSHRTTVDKELVRWGNEFFYIKGDANEEDSVKSVEIGFSEGKKKVRVNGIQLKKRGELLGNLTTVFFSPEELKLVKEGPGYRRKFIDGEILQIKPSYFYVLNNYNKVLFQRNSLLKEIIYKRNLKDTLNVWDKQLASYGAKIIYYRERFIKKLSMLSRLMHRKITSGDEELDIKYKCCVKIKENHNLTDIEEMLIEQLNNRKDKDISIRTSTFGPHREDLEICINGVDARKFGSQGQQRTAALSMKLSELELVKSEIGEYPVLLLDDVMSELDIMRQKYLIENLADVQVFVTCTVLSDIMKERCKERKVFEVNKGIITMVDI